MAFGPEVDESDPKKIIKPPTVATAEAVKPLSAVEQYFARVQPSQTAAQTTNPYLAAVSNNTGDLFNRMAGLRRQEALATPRYQEPSGINPSISTLAAVYGLTYDEAAKRFASPSVPAMGGGGLRGLMEYS